MAKLSAKKEKFLIAYLNANTVEDARREAGISQSSAYNYLNDPLFKAEYRKKRKEIMQHVTSRLQQSAVLAVDTLKEVMEDKENSTPSSRVQSARAVLENAYRGVEIEELSERVEQLEELLHERNQ